jgi:hypothetical protein
MTESYVIVSRVLLYSAVWLVPWRSLVNPASLPELKDNLGLGDINVWCAPHVSVGDSASYPVRQGSCWSGTSAYIYEHAQVLYWSTR